MRFNYFSPGEIEIWQFWKGWDLYFYCLRFKILAYLWYKTSVYHNFLYVWILVMHLTAKVGLLFFEMRCSILCFEMMRCNSLFPPRIMVTVIVVLFWSVVCGVWHLSVWSHAVFSSAWLNHIWYLSYCIIWNISIFTSPSIQYKDPWARSVKIMSVWDTKLSPVLSLWGVAIVTLENKYLIMAPREACGMPDRVCLS